MTYYRPYWKSDGFKVFDLGSGYSSDTHSASYYSGYQRGNGKGYMRFYQCGYGDSFPRNNCDFNIIYEIL